MSEFDLNNFIHKRNEENSDDPVTPSWYEKLSEAQKKIYHAITQNFIKIESLIESKNTLAIKDRRIVLSRIAKEVNVDRSYITKRRMPQIINFIGECNDKLDRAWKATRKNPSSRKLTKKELEKEVSRLKELLSEERDKNISDFINSALDHGLNETHKAITLELAECKAQIAQNHEVIANLRLQLKNRILNLKD